MSCDCYGGWKISYGMTFHVNCSMMNNLSEDDSEKQNDNNKRSKQQDQQQLESSSTLCLNPPKNSICGIPKFNGTYYRRSIPSITQLSFDINELFGLKLMNPKPLSIELIHDVPIRLNLMNNNTIISFTNCTIHIGNNQCTSCDICNDNGIQFDCRNIRLLQLGQSKWEFFRLPRIKRQCITLA